MRPNNENVICQAKSNVSLPSHSDVGTLLKAKDSSFLSFSSGFQPPNIAVHRTVVYVGIVILAVKTEKKATCWRERRKQDFNSCPASVLLRSTKLPSRGALTAASDTDTIDSAVRSACTV